MTVEILCRYDAAQQKPVVFLRDTIQGDKIQVWSEGSKATLMPLDYYGMTRHLSAEDERVLMERFKVATNRQDQIVHINHRMPRQARPTPNLIANTSAPAPMKDINPAPTASQRKASGNAKPLDQQPAPQGPTGDLPMPGETPAALPAADKATAPVQQDRRQPDPNEPKSATIFRNIEELNIRLQQLQQVAADAAKQLQDATTDLEATKEACKQLITDYNDALDAEKEEEMRKRNEMLAALTATVSAAVPDPLAAAVQALHDAGTAPVQEAPAETQKTPATAPASKTTAQRAPSPAKTAATKATAPAAKSTSKKK